MTTLADDPLPLGQAPFGIPLSNARYFPGWDHTQCECMMV